MDEEFPMHRAAEEGDLDRLRELIELTVNSHDHFGRTPLHFASREGRYAVAELLISSKCDVNIKDRWGQTPVLLAAQSWNQSIVTLLLQHGAQINCADEEGRTLLHYASRNGWKDLVHSILDRREVDINVATRSGDTPLITSVRWGRNNIAALLVQAGADINRSGELKRTALHWAASMSRTRLVQFLLQKELLDLNPQDEDGRTPLHSCVTLRHRAVVMQLLVAGADTALKNNEGETALSEGIRRERLTLEDVRLFVQHGAFLQECDYVRISLNPVLKKSFLKDVGLCTQSIVNKFHHQSLPALKSISYFARQLPNIDEFKLNARQVDEVEKLVRCEIERHAFCNVVKAHPMALSALCVLSLITFQSGTKRSASPDLGDNNLPFKKLHT